MAMNSEGTGHGSVERVFPRILNQVKSANIANGAVDATKLTSELLGETLGVTSVNGMTGDVTIEVGGGGGGGAVTSVNGQTGDVILALNAVTVVNLTYATTVATDASAGDIFNLTLTGNATLANPTNPVDGKTLRWRIKQDATGSRSLALGSKFKMPSSATSPLPFSTAAGAMDVLAATYDAGRDKWDIVAFIMGY